MNIARYCDCLSGFTYKKHNIKHKKKHEKHILPLHIFPLPFGKLLLVIWNYSLDSTLFYLLAINKVANAFGANVFQRSFDPNSLWYNFFSISSKLLANYVYNFEQLASNYVALEKLLLDSSQSGSIKLLIRRRG